MATILVLDTSTEACSCALSLNGEVYEAYDVIPRQHAQKILPMIHGLMAEYSLEFSQLDAIAFGRGPGSFTGLRIAAGVTQGIAFAADLPVIPVSTLASLALDVHETTQAEYVLSCLDARIDEVYWGLYRFKLGVPTLVGVENLCKPEQMYCDTVPTIKGLCAGGNGLSYSPRFPKLILNNLHICLPELLPRAGHMAKIAAVLWLQQQYISAEAITPVYLRDNVTHQ